MFFFTALLRPAVVAVVSCSLLIASNVYCIALGATTSSNRCACVCLRIEVVHEGGIAATATAGSSALLLAGLFGSWVMNNSPYSTTESRRFLLNGEGSGGAFSTHTAGGDGPEGDRWWTGFPVPRPPRFKVRNRNRNKSWEKGDTPLTHIHSARSFSNSNLF